MQELQQRPPSTPKETAFLVEYSKTLNATEAAMRVYDCSNRDSARSIGSQNLSKLAFSDVFDELGLTNIRIGKLILEGVEDKNPVIRYKYLELVLRLKGLMFNSSKNTEKDKRVDNLNQLLDQIVLNKGS